ncbi:hypothetical protein F2Q68_00042178 [Brassica cretica]|uniref:Uncharacterized protein n=1 Tax=Brassica cretica TaxID=69181 RepID=A0A8S9MJB8_BRACR|nr:hypothetical protein F2Q68_00042178 [Brassica cretica]
MWSSDCYLPRLMIVTPIIPQSQAYHDFADQRSFFGNFSDPHFSLPSISRVLYLTIDDPYLIGILNAESYDGFFTTVESLIDGTGDFSVEKEFMSHVSTLVCLLAGLVMCHAPSCLHACSLEVTCWSQAVCFSCLQLSSCHEDTMMGSHPEGRVTACSVRCSVFEYLMEMMGDRKYFENLGSTIEKHRPCHFRSSMIGGVTSTLCKYGLDSLVHDHSLISLQQALQKSGALSFWHHFDDCSDKNHTSCAMHLLAYLLALYKSHVGHKLFAPAACSFLHTGDLTLGWEGTSLASGDRKYSENLGSTIEKHRPCHFRSSTIGGVTSTLCKYGLDSLVHDHSLISLQQALQKSGALSFWHHFDDCSDKNHTDYREEIHQVLCKALEEISIEKQYHDKFTNHALLVRSCEVANLEC